jgi:hypothetical protein
VTEPQPTPELPDVPTASKRRVAPVLVSILAAVLVLGGALAIPVFLGAGDKSGSGDGGTTTLADVEKFDISAPRHVSGQVAYAQSPPVGGNHNRVWLACGRYDAPVRNEFAVHDLEHGTVWITYRPDLPAEDVALLARSLPAEGIMSPFDGLDAPVAVTVWGVQLRLDGPDDPRLARLRRRSW